MAKKNVKLVDLTPVQQLALQRLQEAADRRASLPRAGYGEGPGYLDISRLAKVADHTLYSLYDDCRDLGLADMAAKILADLRSRVSGLS